MENVLNKYNLSILSIREILSSIGLNNKIEKETYFKGLVDAQILMFDSPKFPGRC